MKDLRQGNPQEELLQSWIEMSLCIRGNRLVSGLSFNEIVICRLLYVNQIKGGQPLTATDLCKWMQLLKSQINKLLTTMEKRGLIERVRSENDRRKIEVHLRPEAQEVYLQAHEKIIKIMDHVCETLGDEQSRELTVLLRRAVRAMAHMPESDKGKDKTE